MESEDDPVAVFDRLLETLLAHSPAGDALEALIDWPAFWQRDHASEEWLAWPLIPAGRQVALYAPAKTGKSIVLLAAVAALAAGRPIFGRPALPPRHVLYLDYEMTEGDLYDRLEALGYGPDVDLSHLHYALLPSFPPLNTIGGRNAVVELARKVDAALVVIDTMGRAVNGEENSADPYREYARLTGIALKADGRAVARTDHAGKVKDQGQRGSSAKNDDVDVVLRLDATEGGWVLTRTHTRIAWAPERVALTRREDRDGYVSITIAEGERRTYKAGTRELADQLRALGITHAWSVREAAKLARPAGINASNGRLTDAVAWLKDELPTFPSPVDNPVDKSVQPVDNSGERGRGTRLGVPGPERGEEHPGALDESPGQTMGNAVGERGEHPPAEERGTVCPIYRGTRSPTVPGDDDDGRVW